MEFVEAEPLTGAGPCPFCEGNEGETPAEVWAERRAGSAADGPGWRVRVVPNKFPALRADDPGRRSEVGFLSCQAGFGAHEVVVEGSAHATRWTETPREVVLSTLHAYRTRLRSHRAAGRFAHGFVFKNVGMRAGASLSHNHSQLVALPFVPEAIRRELEGAARHYGSHGRCIYCDLVRKERTHRERLVFESARHVAFTAFAGRFPFETWIAPARHAPRFEDADDGDLEDLTNVLLTTLSRLDRSLDSPPYNVVLHGAPFGSSGVDTYHWHLEILPRIVATAGFEFGTGVFINAVLPEEAARVLRGHGRFGT